MSTSKSKKSTPKKSAAKSASKKAAPVKTGMPKRASKKAAPQFDVKTPAGRAEVDALIVKRLAAVGAKGASRSELAEATKLGPRVVSASLARLKDADLAASKGEFSKRRWFAAAKK